MLTAAAIAMFVSMALALARAFAGPSFYDRMLAVNVFGTKTVLLISLIAAWTDRSDILDVALLYALLSFLGTIAVLRFVKRGSFGSGGVFDSPPDEGSHP